MKYFKNYINKDAKFDKITWIGIFSLIIVISGTFGWLYEFIFYYLNSGMKTFYYRGANFLPWINIYATGSIMIFFLTYKLRKKPILVFIISFISTGILEYFSGYFMYKLMNGIRCWNYNTEILNFGNIDGFVCLRSVLFFGLSALLLIYVIIPFIFKVARKMNKKTFLILSISLCFVFLFDEFYNLFIARLVNLPRAKDIYQAIGFKYMNYYK